MYEPYNFTGRHNKDKYKYPRGCPLGENENYILYFDKNKLEEFLLPVIEFQKKYNIPDNQILVGEFGVIRTNKGAEKYLEYLISILNKYKWHWAFYSYREDIWIGIDYELGTNKKLIILISLNLKLKIKAGYILFKMKNFNKDDILIASVLGIVLNSCSDGDKDQDTQNKGDKIVQFNNELKRLGLPQNANKDSIGKLGLSLE